MQDQLYDDPNLTQFYDLENGWGDDTRYCLKLAEAVHSVLDLGCGTGLLATALANGREVCGIDPAGAMLDVARRRDGGGRVNWIEADARGVRLGHRFDLVVMTGHAFQVLLTDEDQRAVCGTIAAHLAPGGQFIFDTRNPGRQEWRQWTPELSRRSIRHPAFGGVEAWNDVAHDAATGIVTYGTFYRAGDGRLWTASSRIRFSEQQDIAARLAEAGLAARHWLGNWNGSEFVSGAKEIIPLGGLA
jgi:SAM-dependent methyltransferase